ncbi:acetyl-CoA carboxylase carboxyl transferase subunit alpha, partial [Bacillus haikouensis]|nr:acetyl-CoA carboxylase carboxyl transferase subunit alpha [Bacillus haikouensis]
MVNEMEFEKPVVELKKKIAELKEFTQNSEVDLSKEIEKLEARLQKLQNDIYENMKPWERVQVARHPNRPTTLDYIRHLFTGFMEIHGDRLYGDDEAIVSGIAKFEGVPVTVIGHQRGKDTKENIRR